MKHALLAAGLALVAGVTAGCGGGEGGSGTDRTESASTSEFCTSYNSLFESFAGSTEPPSDAESVKAVKEWAAALSETGTPEGIPAEARDGFDVVIATIEEIDADATQEEIQAMTDDLSKTERTNAEAFGAYATETCPRELPGGAPEGSDESPSPSDTESE